MAIDFEGMTQQLNEIELQLENPVTAEDILIMKRFITVLDKSEKLLDRVKNAGIDTQGNEQRIREQKDRINRIIREFS